MNFVKRKAKYIFFRYTNVTQQGDNFNQRGCHFLKEKKKNIIEYVLNFILSV